MHLRHGACSSGRHGHPPFWEQPISRSQFLRTAATTTGLVVASGFWTPRAVSAAQAQPASGADPRPIPGSDPRLPAPVHVFFPEPGLELATITDFDGVVGATDVQGTGKGTDTRTGQSFDLLFDTDMRFMKGTYLGVDGQRRSGTFGFI